MDTREILSRVQSGEISVDDALKHLKTQPFEDLGYAMIDHHRAVRQGAGEVVYGAGKTAEQIAGICAHLAAAGAENILITRMSPDKAEYVRKAVPLDYDPMPQVGVAAPKKIEPGSAISRLQPAERAICPSRRRLRARRKRSEAASRAVRRGRLRDCIDCFRISICWRARAS